MVLDDVPLTQMNRERLDRVLAPKMAGAWHLHQETLNESLDWFAMFSSLAAIIGNPYQANYAAANAFLDAHAQRASRPRSPCTLDQLGNALAVGLPVAPSSRWPSISSAKGICRSHPRRRSRSSLPCYATTPVT